MAAGPARRARIDPFVVMEVVAAANALDATTGSDVVHLEVGQPSTGAPAVAVAAARAHLDAGDPLGYTEACGLPALRAAIAERYERRHGIEVDPERVVVTVGASAACVLAFLAAFDAGARVAVTEPGYPCYRQMLHALDVEAVPVRVGPDTGFALTPEALAAAGPLDGVVVASPANPTGTVLDATRLDSLRHWCHEAGVRLVADEIYQGITFEAPAPSAAGDPRVVVIGSFSKYFSMTGWRLGWMLVPPDLATAVDRLAQNLFLCPPALAQHAASAALEPAAEAELETHVARYRTNRDLVLATLAELGVTTVAPADGAFYVYAEVSDWHGDSVELCRSWLDELHLAATPGVDFDPVDGRRWVRFSVSGSTDDVAEAMARLRRWRNERTGTTGTGRTAP